jgi:hypothetical protein
MAPLKRYIDVQAGAALIEFAIILPLLLLLTIGIVEFSYAFYHLNILNKSIENGARYFSTSLIARNGNVGSLIDTRTSENKTNIDATKNLIIYGDIDDTGYPLMPNAANYASILIFCAEESSSNKICDTTTNHIRITAVYNHNLLLGDVLNNFMALNIINNQIPLRASSVMRVE